MPITPDKYSICGYTRISVDLEEDRDNTSIENQKAIITDYVHTRFPGSSLDLYCDRDRSGYTFEQREDYQSMRRMMLERKYDILIVKDFSRFSRRNSRGLVELEDLRDAGVRIISIGDSVDYPTDDDWLKIQFQFLINEMPVTDTSKKVKSVIRRRQSDGKWICAVPFGYVMTNNKNMAFEVDPAQAEIVRKIFELYIAGWGYKRIAHHLTELHIPTARMTQKERMESRGEECRLKARAQWSMVSVQEILDNDFYIGTLRQGKYSRAKINGADVKRDEAEHIVFENHHDAIIDYTTFARTRALREQRTRSNYRGTRVYDNVYSGLMRCGDCNAPMFSRSRGDMKPSYICGSYHNNGLKGCTSHHIRVDMLDSIVKSYLSRIRDESGEMLRQIEQCLSTDTHVQDKSNSALSDIQARIDMAMTELRATKSQKVRDLLKRPEAAELTEATYDEIERELETRIDGLKNQLKLTSDRKNSIVRIKRITHTALEVFDSILAKDNLTKSDIELIVDCILVYETHIEIKLKSDIDMLICAHAEQAQSFVQSAEKHLDKEMFVRIASEGDPLEIFTDRDGEVILKKYSPIGELGDFAKEYADSLYQALGHTVAICDKDTVIAVAGTKSKELMDKPINTELEEMMQNREKMIINKKDGKSMISVTLSDSDVDSYTSQAFVPILSSGDAIGIIVLIGRDESNYMEQTELKVCETAANFLGKQMEN